MARYVSALVAVFAIVLASASPAAAITNGTPDGEWHTYVGMAWDEGSFCSGTLIAPTVFLTAAHCIYGFATPDGLVVSFASDASVIHATAAAIDVEPLGYDVGVIILNEDMSAFGLGYLPAEGAVDQLGNNASMLAVGYGFTGFTPGNGPPQPAGGGLRQFAPVVFINNNHNYAPQFIKHSTNPGQGRGGTCLGDSGGPIFAEGSATILGITSFGGKNCNAVSYAQRMDLPDVQDWLATFGVPLPA